MNDSPSPSRAIPSVERLVQALEPAPVPRPLVVHLVRQHVDALRRGSAIPPAEEIVAALRNAIAALARSRLQPIINATGILAHTNLGRSPLSASAVQCLAAVAGAYSNLELDLESGDRGSRGAYLERGLAVLCEAEAAAVVNNCAAALVLVLRHFARGERAEVVISRGELVQIGGGFRIPEILEASGARLREVGTTNRTALDDYRRALGPQTALVLKIHRSNFRMEGFVESPGLPELAALTSEFSRSLPEPGVPLVEDLGSGALVDPASIAPIASEPQPQASLRAGTSLVCFSGDKLFGGPQAGIIVGRTQLVEGLRRDPLFRALRCDKLAFAALQATVDAYLEAGARRDHGPPVGIPILDSMRLSVDALRERTTKLAAKLADLPVEISVVDSQAEVGGGVCPGSTIPSVALRLKPKSGGVDALAGRLRRGNPPVIGFIASHALHLDLRTVLPCHDAALMTTVIMAVSQS